jgi:malonate-semialdehyde dehydrogenase (acetylating)/methylmalonate-semialdehyde dehydrogenase
METVTMKYPPVRNFINGNFVEEDSLPLIEVISPVDGALLSSVPMASAKSLSKAVAAAASAFPAWAATPIKERVQVFYRYRELLLRDREQLSRLVSEENGKTLNEATAEVDKAIELTEFACSLPQIATGEILEVSKGVECRSEYAPLGVVASIVPFNFPSMVPHWSIPNALVLGNTMITKPSEHVPLSVGRVALLLKEAGLPDGVFNVVNGAKEMVEAICDHPDIAAISFVGSTKVAKLVYARGTSNLKRVLALGGAKNHLVVLPDANPQMAASNIVASAIGCAGQRCMAASVMVAVGNVDHIIDLMISEAGKSTCGINLGAIITRDARDRIQRYITDAESQGAAILVDGRNAVAPGKEGGFYVGPTIIDHVRPDMAVAREEVFGPVLSIIRVSNVAEAMEIENANPYGNAVGVFTQSGAAAKYVADHASAGMVGVNIGVPVPREPFSFGGWNDSKFGALDLTGKSSIEFWTKQKKITTKWNPEAGVNWMS